jgi:serine/threonine protein kinase
MTAISMMLLSITIHLFLIVGFIPEFSIAASDDEQFVFTGFSGSNLTLDGAARITSTGLIELTNDTARIKGHAFYPSPLHFRQSPDGTVQSFSLSFVFGILSSFGDIRGHGFAFFISPSKDFTDAYSIQFLGLFNSTNNGSLSNHIFAVELDTIQNTEFGDIDNNHVGIDINSLNSLKSYTAGFYNDKNGTFTNLSLIGSGPIQTWVEYDAKKTQIDVTIAPLGLEKPVTPLLSLAFNLSTILTEEAYIGFSSSTGLSTGHHCILGLSFGMNSPAPTIDSTKLPKLPYLGPRPPSKLLEIILPIASALLVLVIGTTVVILIRRHFRYKEVREDWEVEYGPQRFTYKDLFHATKGFNSKHLIGVGGFGRVYKGVLPKSKSEVAVKMVPYNSKQGIKQFTAEVVSLGHLQHNNIVQLHGYCRRKGEFFLVYDYMVNGSLDKYLYDEEGRSTLDWGQRFKIIKDIASGLLYLHEEWDKVVVHRDVKPNNVLLDKNMNGRLGDFGLARLYDHGTDPHTTHVVGTIGYLAPELVNRGKATTLTDVFAFGVFILEVTCGKKPINEDTRGNQLMLVDWVIQNWHKDSLLDTIDIKLQGKYDIDEACLALKLGLLCSHPSPDARPSMRQVLQYLDGEMTLPELLPAHFSFHMLALLQNETRLNTSTVSLYPSPIMMMDFGSVSFSLDGR